MEITIKCTCGNVAKIPAPNKKLTMLRDYLETENFKLIKAENKEIEIWCDKCKSWIALKLN